MDYFEMKFGNKVLRFKNPHEARASHNGKFFAVFPAAWESRDAGTPKSWDYEYFRGVVDISGKILWQNQKVEKVDFLSDDGLTAFNVIPSGETSPWDSLEIYKSTYSISIKPMGSSVSQAWADISNDGRVLLLSVMTSAGNAVLLYDSNGTEIWHKIYADSDVPARIAISPGGKYVALIRWVRGKNREQFVTLLDRAQHQLWETPTQKNDRRDGVVFSDDEDEVVVFGHNGAESHKVERNQVAWRFHRDGILVSHIQFAPDTKDYVLTARTRSREKDAHRLRYAIVLNSEGSPAWETQFEMASKDRARGDSGIEIGRGGRGLYIRAADKIEEYEIGQ